MCNWHITLVLGVQCSDWYLYTLHNGGHSKSSYHASLYIVTKNFFLVMRTFKIYSQYSIINDSHSLVTQMVKNRPEMQETQVRSLGWEDPLEEGMATHSSILAWRIPWTEEPGGLQSMGSQRLGEYTHIPCYTSHPMTDLKLKVYTFWLPSPIASTSHSPSPLATTILFYLSMSLDFVSFFRCHIYVWSYGICLSLPDLPHLVKCPQGPPMLSQMAAFHSFFLAG